jgi:hypothetical protein
MTACAAAYEHRRRSPSAPPPPLPRLHCARSLPSVVLLLALAGPGCSHRSTAEMAGELPISHEITRIRIEIQNGTVGVRAHDARTVAFAGGVRRGADSAAELAELERIPIPLAAAPDPLDPRTMVVRGPALQPGGVQGVLGVEVGIRLPADLPLEIVIAGSGHVTAADRRASTSVETGRGDLRFAACAGGVKARTGRGNVIAYDHRGDLDIQTKVGDMQAFVREPGTQLVLVTGQGTVQCHVPPTIGFDLDARAQIGRIGNGFGLTAETVLKYGAALVAKRGDARTRIVLRTGSGHLSIAPKSYD